MFVVVLLDLLLKHRLVFVSRNESIRLSMKFKCTKARTTSTMNHQTKLVSWRGLQSLPSSPFSPRIQNLIFHRYLWQWNLSRSQNVTLSASTLPLLLHHSGSTPTQYSQSRQKRASVVWGRILISDRLSIHLESLVSMLEDARPYVKLMGYLIAPPLVKKSPGKPQIELARKFIDAMGLGELPDIDNSS